MTASDQPSSRRRVLAVCVVLATPVAVLCVGRGLAWMAAGLPDWLGFAVGAIVYPCLLFAVVLLHARCQWPPWSHPVQAIVTGVAACVVAAVAAWMMNPSL
jgi:hypothetical protein